MCPLGDAGGDFELSLRKDGPWLAAPELVGRWKALEEADGHRREDEDVSGVRGPDRLDERSWPGVFEQEASRARAQCAVHVFVGVKGGDDHDAERVGDVGTSQCAGDLDAVEPGHADVDQGDVVASGRGGRRW